MSLFLSFSETKLDPKTAIAQEFRRGLEKGNLYPLEVSLKGQKIEGETEMESAKKEKFAINLILSTECLRSRAKFFNIAPAS